MDAELTAVISTAATTLVKLLTTDSWELAKSAVGPLWRRVHPDHDAVIEAELADSRAELLAARGAGDAQVERDVEIEWRGRLRSLVLMDPGIADELSRLVRDLGAALSALQQAPAGRVDMRVHASGHSQVYQAGRDQHISRP